jgi:hypothetical protein
VRILLAMLNSKDRSLNSEAVLKETGIALSTWSAEQGKLGEMGLIEKHLVRVITHDSVSKRMNYTLTESGALVALNLLKVSRVLARTASAQIARSKNESFEERIRECVEIGLDSFGMNLITLVRSALESEYGMNWNDISNNPDQLLNVCKDLFGDEASKKLETLISANIAARFAIASDGSMQGVISKARKTFAPKGELSEQNGQKALDRT